MSFPCQYTYRASFFSCLSREPRLCGETVFPVITTAPPVWIYADAAWTPLLLVRFFPLHLINAQSGFNQLLFPVSCN